jgi:alpha-beta hydrolase superfamily lysophospholipase
MGYINVKDLSYLINTAKNEIEEQGRNVKSTKAFNALFEHANDEFEPSKTGFDWITSDEVLLAESLNSPYASVFFTAGFYLDLFNALVDVKQAKNLLRIPRNLPIFSVSGSKDPFGFNGFGVKTLFEGYKSLGFKDVSYNIYKNKRHSILRETNRAQVTIDIISWINERISN